MIACLFGESLHLSELADQFSPLVEIVAENTVAFSVDGLTSLFGDPHQIAAEIARRGTRMNISANLSIAANKSTAILAARNLAGVTIIERGSEVKILAEIPIEALPAPPELLKTLLLWGVHTVGDLVALPETGVVERLGEAGNRLRRMAMGQGDDVLALYRPSIEYLARREFDDPVETLEPLFFVISAQLHDLTEKLRSHGKSAIRVIVTLSLDRDGTFVRTLDLPLAMRDPVALLKQVQLSLESDPPKAGALAVEVALVPADPRVIQHGLFRPAAPEPDKLQTLLARLRALTGPDRVGSPEVLNTHRPDAFRIRPCAFEDTDAAAPPSQPLRLAFRYFRPPLEAKVDLKNYAPVRVISSQVSGKVIHSAGPWRTSGGLWAASSWDRDEWDLVLEDQAVYRIYLTPARRWFLCGSYD